MKKLFQFLIVSVFLSSFALKVNAQPLSPFNLTATVGHWGMMSSEFEFVNLSWQFTTNSPKSGLTFNVYRKLGAISDTGAFIKKYTHLYNNQWRDINIHRGETYSYYVTAQNSLGESSPSDTVQISIDSVTAKVVVSGTIKDKVTGNPIKHGNVIFLPAFGWFGDHAVIDSSGNYSTKLFPGTYIAYCVAPGYVPQYYNDVRYIFNATKITVTASGISNLDFSLQPKPVQQHFMLSGTVTDSLGNPIKAIIRIHDVYFNTFHHRYSYAITNDSGKYSVPVLQGDTVIVFARALDHQYFPQFYNDKSSFLDADRIGISGDTSNINFMLVHKPVYNNGVSGTVQSNDSVGVESIVMAIRLGTDMHWRHRYTTESDSLGNYSFDHMIPGTYIFLAIPEGDYNPTFYMADGSQNLHWKDADSVIVDSTSMITGINFIVTDPADSGNASINGHVADNSNNPLAGVIVFATDANQETYSYGITDANGNYTISGLIPGQYSVSSDAYGYTSTQTTTSSVDYNSSYTTSASFSLTPESVTVVQNQPNVVSDYKLNQNYPNPFNPTTIISYQIPTQSRVVLKVFNVLGKEVATLVDGIKPAGSYNIQFNAANLASGVYFYQIRAGNFYATKKLVLLK